jgi:hypothetical protein
MMEKAFVVSCPRAHRSRLFTSVDRANTRPGVRRGFIVSTIAACWVAMLATASAERAVTLAWDRSPDSGAIGYRIYAREENGATPKSINVLGLTKVTVPGLKEGLRYTFTVTSYNAAGVESPPSNAAEFVVPVPLNLLPGTTTDAAKRLQFPVVPGKSYELQASTDLQSWATIWQTSTTSTYAWTEFQDPLSTITIKDHRETGFRSRFYRLRIR